MTETTVEIELDDDLLLKLAMMAHEEGITLNELCVEILEAYVGGYVNLTPEEQELKDLEDSIVETSKNIVLNGVTEETLSRFGQAFTDWNLEYHGNKTYRELIQKGFDEADNEEPDRF